MVRLDDILEQRTEGGEYGLTIQERLKDLRVERGLTLEQLAEQTHLSKSALGSYEAEDFKDISHYAIIKLAKFYGVTAIICWGCPKPKITQTPICRPAFE